MEMIMTLVIEESEDISSELISCLLDSVRNDDKVTASLLIFVVSFTVVVYLI